MLAFASAFLYALITDRVLLIDAQNIPDLLCEPFPDVSWLLPSGFPLGYKFGDPFQINAPDSLGNYLNNNKDLNASVPFPEAYVYIHLMENLRDDDKRFFCDEEQSHIHDVPWLVMKTDLYFIPSLFVMPSFEQELHNLFPNKEVIFHLLGHYLLHPSNTVWGLVHRYYKSYLSKADVKVGMQIRLFDRERAPDPEHHLSDQILPCSLDEGILPRTYNQQQQPSINQLWRKNDTTVSVMITSLYHGYFETLKNLFWENPTTTDETVFVSQPSFEEFQATGNSNHDIKSLAEIYLLSLTDKLITSPFSTFGYVAQSLSGKRSWILFYPNKEKSPVPSCQRMISMDPCYLIASFYDCNMKRSFFRCKSRQKQLRPICNSKESTSKHHSSRNLGVDFEVDCCRGGAERHSFLLVVEEEENPTHRPRLS